MKNTKKLGATEADEIVDEQVTTDEVDEETAADVTDAGEDSSDDDASDEPNALEKALGQDIENDLEDAANKAIKDHNDGNNDENNGGNEPKDDAPKAGGSTRSTQETTTLEEVVTTVFQGASEFYNSIDSPIYKLKELCAEHTEIFGFVSAKNEQHKIAVVTVPQPKGTQETKKTFTIKIKESLPARPVGVIFGTNENLRKYVAEQSIADVGTSQILPKIQKELSEAKDSTDSVGNPWPVNKIDVMTYEQFLTWMDKNVTLKIKENAGIRTTIMKKPSRKKNEAAKDIKPIEVVPKEELCYYYRSIDKKKMEEYANGVRSGADDVKKKPWYTACPLKSGYRGAKLVTVGNFIPLKEYEVERFPGESAEALKEFCEKYISTAFGIDQTSQSRMEKIEGLDKEFSELLGITDDEKTAKQYDYTQKYADTKDFIKSLKKADWLKEHGVSSKGKAFPYISVSGVSKRIIKHGKTDPTKKTYPFVMRDFSEVTIRNSRVWKALSTLTVRDFSSQDPEAKKPLIDEGKMYRLIANLRNKLDADKKSKSKRGGTTKAFTRNKVQFDGAFNFKAAFDQLIKQ